MSACFTETPGDPRSNLQKFWFAISFTSHALERNFPAKIVGVLCLFCDWLHLLLRHGPGMTGYISELQKADFFNLSGEQWLYERGIWELETHGECGNTSCINSSYHTRTSRAHLFQEHTLAFGVLLGKDTIYLLLSESSDTLTSCSLCFLSQYLCAAVWAIAQIQLKETVLLIVRCVKSQWVL